MDGEAPNGLGNLDLIITNATRRDMDLAAGEHVLTLSIDLPGGVQAEDLANTMVRCPNLKKLHLKETRVLGDFSIFSNALAASLALQEFKCNASFFRSIEEVGAVGTALAQSPCKKDITIMAGEAIVPLWGLFMPTLQNDLLAEVRLGDLFSGDQEHVVREFFLAAAASTTLWCMNMAPSCDRSRATIPVSAMGAVEQMVRQTPNLNYLFLPLASAASVAGIANALGENQSLQFLNILRASGMNEEEAKAARDTLERYNFTLYDFSIHGTKRFSSEEHEQHINKINFILRLNLNGRARLLAPEAHPTEAQWLQAIADPDVSVRYYYFHHYYLSSNPTAYCPSLPPFQAFNPSVFFDPAKKCPSCGVSGLHCPRAAFCFKCGAAFPADMVQMD